MSVKALRTQLIAAIAMVLVASLALGSSTFAWFANNSKVTATGMMVQAQTEGGIEIAYSRSTETTGSFSTSATTTATVASSLAPTSTFDTSAWFHSSAANAGSYQGTAESCETLTGLSPTPITGQAFGNLYGKTAGETTTNYYMLQNFNIRSTSASSPAKGLKIDKVSVAGNSANMSEALRVAVKLGSKTYIYDPVANDTTGYTVYSGHTGTGSTATKNVAGTVTITEKDTPVLLGASSDTEIPAKGDGVNGGVDVSVYVWFEGEDAQLYSDNFATEGLTISIQFSAVI